MREKATISDIAIRSGVSVATVSRALSNRGYIKQATKDKIFDVARELGYRFPASQGSDVKRNILLLVPQISNPYYSQIFEGAQAVAVRNGYNLMVSQPPTDSFLSEDQLLWISNSSELAGLILLHVLPEKDIARCNQLGIPFVYCSEYADNYNCPYVSIDDTLAAKNATEYLISIGRTKIAFINCSLSYKYACQREQSFCSTMQEAGLEVNPDWVIHLPDVTYEVAFSSVMRLLQQSNIPNAIFAISDVYAAAAIKAATRLGLRVPQDIAVVGFDDIELAAMFEPSITTVQQPRYQLGSLSCNILIDRINNPNSALQKVLLNTHLIIRESTRV